jgi:hypothetical protein
MLKNLSNYMMKWIGVKENSNKTLWWWGKNDKKFKIYFAFILSTSKPRWCWCLPVETTYLPLLRG